MNVKLNNVHLVLGKKKNLGIGSVQVVHLNVKEGEVLVREGRHLQEVLLERCSQEVQQEEVLILQDEVPLEGVPQDVVPLKEVLRGGFLPEEDLLQELTIALDPETDHVLEIGRCPETDLNLHPEMLHTLETYRRTDHLTDQDRDPETDDPYRWTDFLIEEHLQEKAPLTGI